MGSADLMPRNLDHRVEVVTPIEDAGDPGRARRRRSRRSGATPRPRSSSTPDGVWQRVEPKKDERAAVRTADADAARAAAGLARPQSLNRSSTSQVRNRTVTGRLRRLPIADLRCDGDASRSHRRRVEHDPAARCERGPTALAPVDKAEGAPLARRGDRALGVVSDVHLAAAAKAVREMAPSAGASASTRSTSSSPLPAVRRATPTSSSRRCRGPQACRPASSRRRRKARLPTAAPSLTAGVDLPSRIAVCDVGGASTEIAVGRPGQRSRLDRVGRPRLRPSHRRAPGTCAAEAASRIRHLEPPTVEAALAVGGSARAARRLVGAELGEAELAEALRLVETTLAARDRSALRRRPRARRDPPGGCHPARRGAAAARSPAARLQRRHPRGRRPRLARRARGLDLGADLAHDLSVAAARPLRPSSGRGRASSRTTSPCVQQTTPSSWSSSSAAWPAPSARRSSSSTGSPSAAASGSTVSTQRTYGLETTRRTSSAPQELDELRGLAATSLVERAQSSRRRPSRHGRRRTRGGRARSSQPLQQRQIARPAEQSAARSGGLPADLVDLVVGRRTLRPRRASASSGRVFGRPLPSR